MRNWDHDPIEPLGTFDWIRSASATDRAWGGWFALAEMTTVVGVVLRRFDLEAVDLRPEAHSMHHSTFASRRGCEVIATPRAGIAS